MNISTCSSVWQLVIKFAEQQSPHSKTHSIEQHSKELSTFNIDQFDCKVSLVYTSNWNGITPQSKWTQCVDSDPKIAIDLDYRGMFPCFRHGFSTFFVFSSSRSSQILWRVFGGSNISSINPLWAAINGLANLIITMNVGKSISHSINYPIL